MFSLKLIDIYSLISDLSFNNISEIPKTNGLETLVNLKELSLFANHIKDISALTPLTSLQILSLGDNEIEELDKVFFSSFVLV